MLAGCCFLGVLNSSQEDVADKRTVNCQNCCDEDSQTQGFKRNLSFLVSKAFSYGTLASRRHPLKNEGV